MGNKDVGVFFSCILTFAPCAITQVQGDNAANLDLGAVQRGDAEMEQKMNRVLRSCIEQKGENPILSIHDQGAGGNGMSVLGSAPDTRGQRLRCSLRPQ